MANSTNTTNLIQMQFWTCFFLDYSEDANYRTIQPNFTVHCRIRGKFLTGEHEIGQHYGRILCVIFCALVYVVGIFGFVTNILNALVLRRSLRGSAVSLKALLIMLAIFELFACLFCMALATMIIIIIENVNRGLFSTYFLKICHVLYSFGRTGAIYITILVTIERYVVVAFPIKSKGWLTPVKSKLYVVFILFLTFLLDFPFLLNETVVKSPFKDVSPNTSLGQFPYIFNGTYFGNVIYPKLLTLQLIVNYIGPFPILLLLNGLLYFSIHSWNRGRQTISRRQKREINAAKVFSIVALILLACLSVCCFLVFYSRYMGIVHRELLLLQLLSVTVSSSINFLVYIGFGDAFRKELRRLMSPIYEALTGRKLVPSGAENNASTQSYSEDGKSSIAVNQRNN